MLKSLLLSITLLASALPYQNYDWGWKKIGPGAECGYAQIELFGGTQSIAVVRYKASRYITDIVGDPEELTDSTAALARRHGGIAGINGSYFNVRRLTPTTFIKDEGEIEGRTTTDETFRVDGLVATNGHTLDIFLCDTLDYEARTASYREALAAGPVLLQDGKATNENWSAMKDGFHERRHPRALIGRDARGWNYLIVIDGRFKGADGASIDECTEICRMFGMTDAINLDGGGSSTVWTEKYGTISHPFDNRKWDHYGQRRVPNAIIIRRK